DTIWSRIGSWDTPEAKQRNEETEWAGDSLVALAMAAEIDEKYPELDDGPYRTILQALTCNLTFAYLSHKIKLASILVRPIGAPKWDTLPMSNKIFADLFEVVVAETFYALGFKGLRLWVHRVFEPLLDIAHHSYHSVKPKTSTEAHPGTLSLLFFLTMPGY
ncbi:hypothetical protein M422DRAFT_29834, partial [Sphaerobolus stellatus SS14]